MTLKYWYIDFIFCAELVFRFFYCQFKVEDLTFLSNMRNGKTSNEMLGNFGGKTRLNCSFTYCNWGSTR